MLTHLFRLIWNKKKQNFLLIVEIFFSFIGLFAAFTFFLYPYNNYKIPTGFEHENVWVVNFNRVEQISSIDSLQMLRESVKKILSSMNGVEDVSLTSVNYPFSGNGFNTPLKYNGDETWANFYTVEENYEKLMRMKMLEGRWFSSDDVVANIRPAVINENLKKDMFGDEDPLGKIIETDAAAGRMKIVGVVQNAKDESEAEIPRAGIYRLMDTADLRHAYSIMIKLKPGADAAFESVVYKTLSNTIKHADIEIEHLSELRADKNRAMRIPFIIIMVISGFLIINVALGIFGVLWYNIHKRRSEIALRRAVGATGNGVSRQLVTEAILITTLALIVGSFFLVQFPLLGVFQLPVNNYIYALIYSTVFIYVLVILCALYPGRQAARIYPAVALHQD